MKKILPVFLILIVIIAASITVSPVSAFAYDITADKITGISLGDYCVKLAYKRYILDYSGVEVGYEVIFDREYVSTNYGDEGQYQIQDVLTELSLLVKNMGYEITTDTVNNSLSAIMKFDTLTDYYIALGIDGYDTYEDNSTKNKGLFFIESESTTKTVFDGIEESEGLMQNFLQNFYNLGITRDEILLSYEYGTPYKIIKTDADTTTFDISRQIYIHKFNMNMDNSDREIHLYQKSPNIVGWYLSVLIVGLIVGGVTTIIYIIRRKNDRRK